MAWSRAISCWIDCSRIRLRHEGSGEVNLQLRCLAPDLLLTGRRQLLPAANRSAPALAIVQAERENSSANRNRRSTASASALRTPCGTQRAMPPGNFDSQRAPTRWRLRDHGRRGSAAGRLPSRLAIFSRMAVLDWLLDSAPRHPPPWPDRGSTWTPGWSRGPVDERHRYGGQDRRRDRELTVTAIRSRSSSFMRILARPAFAVGPNRRTQDSARAASPPSRRVAVSIERRARRLRPAESVETQRPARCRSDHAASTK